MVSSLNYSSSNANKKLRKNVEMIVDDDDLKKNLKLD